jgi:GH35 family endo-1,4-beta-xylanase
MVKTDSLVAYVNYPKWKGARLDGPGTQIHFTNDNAYDDIDNAFRKLAATSLEIRT